ncbi:MAG: YceI family protein [Flavobacteriaceae bacterium]|nr:YceI family protein [Flavobacteriaceae bacterium]
MKKLAVSLFTITLISFTSCKDEKKEVAKETETTEVKKETSFMVDPSATEIQWTAFKTTEKKPVSGVFKTINFEKKMGATPIEALNGLKFSIPVSSLFSKNEERDGKLKASFFGAMLNTELLKGKIAISEEGCEITITMNDTRHVIPFKFDIKDNKVMFKGIMDLEDWNALGALESLNKVCLDLHKGDDGISKTWTDVEIVVNTTLMKH